MLLIDDLVLWILVAFHVVGGATLFRRLYPTESPWLAFIVPALALVLLLNFVEHMVALPVLLWLLPFTVAGLLWSIFSRGLDWTGLLLPTGIFIFAFAWNFALRCLHPDIPTDDALADMNRILDFCFGDKLPPTDSWLPPFDHRWYYSLQHYAASIVKRLFAIDVGTACNTSLALLNSMICLMGAGVAFLASGRRRWVAAAIVPILEAGFTGALPLLVLMMKDPDFGYAADLEAGFRQHDPHAIFQLLGGYSRQALVLEPPGDWIWHPQYHANLSGFLLMFIAAYGALELLDQRPCNWPWVALLLVPPLSMLAATWYLFLCLILSAGALGLALVLGRRPGSWKFVLTGSALGLVLMWPALAAFATWPHHQQIGWTEPVWHTPFWIFVIQWWPIYVPWLVLCFFWRRLSAGVRWLHAAVALLFVLVEMVTVGDWRWDTVEKMWGGIFGLGLVALVPPLMASRHYAARAVTVVILLATLASLCARFDVARRWIDWEYGFLHLEGDAYLRTNPQDSRMLQVLGQLHGSTILSGISRWNYSPPVGLAVFTSNRCYVAWFSSEEICGHAAEADYRTKLNNTFYAGKMERPLNFLRANRIDAVLIAPEDDISDAVLAQLKQSLAPAYDYIDCKAGGPKNAGVFLVRPLPPRRA